MSNTLHDIVRKIQYSKHWTIEELAQDIGYSRVYLSKSIKKNNPKIRQILEDRYRRILQDTEGIQNVTLTGSISNSMVPMERLLKEVERSRDDVKASRDLLARLLESNLTVLASNQQVLLATLQGFVEHFAAVEAKGDKNKIEVLAADIQRKIAEKLAGLSGASNQVAGRK